MRKIIVESAYDDEVEGRPSYFVARYEYETNEEWYDDERNVYHRGWGKTKEEAEYNLLLQDIPSVKAKIKHSQPSGAGAWLYLLLMIGPLAYWIIHDFGTIASLECLIFGIFIFHLETKKRALEEDNINDE